MAWNQSRKALGNSFWPSLGPLRKHRCSGKYPRRKLPPPGRVLNNLHDLAYCEGNGYGMSNANLDQRLVFGLLPGQQQELEARPYRLPET
jgi:hypothetical protein